MLKPMTSLQVPDHVTWRSHGSAKPHATAAPAPAPDAGLRRDHGREGARRESMKPRETIARRVCLVDGHGRHVVEYHTTVSKRFGASFQSTGLDDWALSGG